MNSPGLRVSPDSLLILFCLVQLCVYVFSRDRIANSHLYVQVHHVRHVLHEVLEIETTALEIHSHLQ